VGEGLSQICVFACVRALIGAVLGPAGARIVLYRSRTPRMFIHSRPDSDLQFRFNVLPTPSTKTIHSEFDERKSAGSLPPSFPFDGTQNTEPLLCV
jgi:hypothetical protein